MELGARNIKNVECNWAKGNSLFNLSYIGLDETAAATFICEVKWKFSKPAEKTNEIFRIAKAS